MILEKVLHTIRWHSMFEPGDSVVVAVSGGADSVALLHVLLELRPALPLSLTVAHLDHALRGVDSETDRAYVEDLARRLGLPCRSRREEVAALARRERCSLEEAGRTARRRFLRDVAAQAPARRAALGHHRDDQAESVLLRLIAGSGRAGLSGIKPVAEGFFVRPLFDCSRAEILEYLEARRIPYRNDATNADQRFPRNRLRHGVFPVLRDEFNPRVAEAIARTADILREEDVYLDRTAERLLRELLLDDVACERGVSPASGNGPRAVPSDGSAAHHVKDIGDDAAGAPPGAVPDRRRLNGRLYLDARRLRMLPLPIARRIVRIALRQAGLRGRDLARARIEDVLDLLTREGSNASVSLGGGFIARFEYGRLILQHVGMDDALGRDGAGTDGAGIRENADPAAETAIGPQQVQALGLGTRSKDGLQPLKEPVLLQVPGEAVFPVFGVGIHARLCSARDAEPGYRQAPPERAYVDADLLQPPLQVRTPGRGDRFHPLGAPGSRKLSDLWTDLKLPREARRRTLVVESAGRIVWVAGLRLADPFRITDRTRHVAVLEMLPLREQMSAPSTARPIPVVYTAEEIAGAVDRIARDVDAWAAGDELIVLGVLHGSFIFMADLVRRLPGPLRVGFVDRDGGAIRGSVPLEGARVLLVEDILDTGESLTLVLERLRSHKPAHLRTCVLFDKPARRTVPIEPDFVGLPVPDRWVVGYGLDIEGRQRNLPFLSHI